MGPAFTRHADCGTRGQTARLPGHGMLRGERTRQAAEGVAAFAALAVLAAQARGGPLGRLDRKLPRVLQGRRTSAGIAAARAVSSLAEPEFVGALLVASAVTRWRRGRWWAALRAVHGRPSGSLRPASPVTGYPQGAAARAVLADQARGLQPALETYDPGCADRRSPDQQRPRWLPDWAGGPVADGRRGRGKPGLPGRALAHRHSGRLALRRRLDQAGPLGNLGGRTHPSQSAGRRAVTVRAGIAFGWGSM